MTLQVDGVDVRFGGVHALRGVDLLIEPGQVTGLIGPNGAGKTTLFNVLSGLQEPTGGRVVFGGRDITRLKAHRRARLGIARTFQRLEVFDSLSVRDNVFAAAASRRRWGSPGEDAAVATDRILARTGLTELAHERAGELPTGLARLVEMARAMATEPKLLLLDEPSSGLSEVESQTFGRLLLELCEEGMAVLLVEHDMEFVMEVCRHIFVLDFGTIIASGAPDVVRSDAAVQAAYLGVGHAAGDAA